MLKVLLVRAVHPQHGEGCLCEMVQYEFTLLVWILEVNDVDAGGLVGCSGGQQYFAIGDGVDGIAHFDVPVNGSDELALLVHVTQRVCFGHGTEQTL